MSYVGVGADYQSAMTAAAQSSQTAQETQAADVEGRTLAAAQKAIAGLNSVHLAYWFSPAAAAAAKQASSLCKGVLSTSQCDKVAKSVATEVAKACDRGRKNSVGYALAFATPAAITTPAYCIAARNSLDATYALVLRTLIDVYMELWPAEKSKSIRPDNRLELPAFSAGPKNVAARTVDRRLVLALQQRIVANGGAMTTVGRRPSNPSYCSSSTNPADQQKATQSMLDNRYLPLLQAAKLTLAELISRRVLERMKAEIAKGPNAGKKPAATTPTPAETTSPLVPGGDDMSLPPILPGGDEMSLPPDEGAPPPVEPTQAGMFGVSWKWWLIGAAAVGGVYLFTRKKHDVA